MALTSHRRFDINSLDWPCSTVNERPHKIYHLYDCLKSFWLCLFLFLHAFLLSVNAADLAEISPPRSSRKKLSRSCTVSAAAVEFDLTFIETFFRVVLYIKASVCRITQAKDGAIGHLKDIF